MSLRLTESEYQHYLETGQMPAEFRAYRKPRARPIPAGTWAPLSTADPPAAIEIDDLPLLVLPGERHRKVWTVQRKRRVRQSLAKIIAVRIGGRWQWRSYQMAWITVRRHSQRRPDTDNLHGSCKELLDVLQPMSRRCPDGLGIIRDDSADACSVVVDWARAPAHCGKTTVEIYGI